MGVPVIIISMGMIFLFGLVKKEELLFLFNRARRKIL
jgi:hypothetical protein